MTGAFTVRSSSSGNCTVIHTNQQAILIDAGAPCRAVKQALFQNCPEARVAGMLITHEHTDHIKQLVPLLRAYGCPVYTSEKTAEYLTGFFPEKTTLTVVQEDVPFLLGEVQITPFATPHDAVQSLGFFLNTGCHTLTYATDLGFMPGYIEDYLRKSELAVLESNYDLRMLQSGPYPYFLKRRIMGPKGHLSNEDCAGTLQRLVQAKTRKIILAHLSQHNNLPELALETALQAVQNSLGNDSGGVEVFAAPAQQFLPEVKLD